MDELVGETIKGVELGAHGWRIRCHSGAVIAIDRGHVFDAAGLPVREP